MHATTKRIGTALIALIFAASMTSVFVASATALAEDQPIEPVPFDEASTTTTQGVDNTATDTGSSDDQQSPSEGAASDVATDCTLTLVYTSDPTGEERPGTIFDDQGRVILGTRTLSGFQEGQTVSAWDYVVNIPGHFFFDAWPARITISADPAQNVFTLVYIKLWNYEYTVNYYLMTGADLSADNWKDALDTGHVEFYKMGSEVFDDQQLDHLVNGDAYEYKLDGTYVIDTYPAEIRVGTDADDNVINVLYTPESQNLPDNMPLPDDVVPPAGTDTPPTTLPGDTTLDEDDATTLPPDLTDPDQIEITDEMLEHPVSKQEAEKTKDAYLMGIQVGSDLAQTGDPVPAIVAILVVVAILAAAGAAYALYRRRHSTQS